MKSEENWKNYYGIVDKKRNPFSIRSWREEGTPKGSGKNFENQKQAILNFANVLNKKLLINDLKDTHKQKYPVFQAIRFGFAIIEDNKIIPTNKWSKLIDLGIELEKKEQKISNRKNENQVSIKKNASRIKKIARTNKLLTTSELIEKLQSFDFQSSINNYLLKSKIRSKTPNELLFNFTFSSSIARAFRHESPSDQYKKWASSLSSDKILSDLSMIQNQNDYDNFLFNLAYSLKRSWNLVNKKGHTSKMNIGISLKIINLLLKHLYFCCLSDKKNILSFLHVPWDKYTLLPLKDIEVFK